MNYKISNLLKNKKKLVQIAIFVSIFLSLGVIFFVGLVRYSTSFQPKITPTIASTPTQPATFPKLPEQFLSFEPANIQCQETFPWFKGRYSGIKPEDEFKWDYQTMTGEATYYLFPTGEITVSGTSYSYNLKDEVVTKVSDGKVASRAERFEVFLEVTRLGIVPMKVHYSATSDGTFQIISSTCVTLP